MTSAKSPQPVRILCHSACPEITALMKKAVAELSIEGFGSAITLPDILSGKCSGPLLMLDGDKDQAGRLMLDKAGIKPDFHLVVADLGIESTDNETNREDLQLLKDGIQAVCTITDGPTPKFNCTCCGP